MSVSYETFIADANDFRAKLGEKSFWELSDEKQDEWFKGLGWAFCMLETKDKAQNDRAVIVFQSIVDEFARRRAHIMLHPFKLQEKLA